MKIVDGTVVANIVEIHDSSTVECLDRLNLNGFKAYDNSKIIFKNARIDLNTFDVNCNIFKLESSQIVSSVTSIKVKNLAITDSKITGIASIESNAPLKIDDTIIELCIYIKSPSIKITSSRIGGGVFIESLSNIDIFNSEISACTLKAGNNITIDRMSGSVGVIKTQNLLITNSKVGLDEIYSKNNVIISNTKVESCSKIDSKSITISNTKIDAGSLIIGDFVDNFDISLELIESPHPYPDYYEKTWTITKSNVKAIRVHFAKIDIGWDDYIEVYNSNGNLIKWWEHTELSNVWSKWVRGGTVKIVFDCDENYNKDYGFVVNAIEYLIEKEKENVEGYNLHGTFFEIAKANSMKVSNSKIDADSLIIFSDVILTDKTEINAMEIVYNGNEIKITQSNLDANTLVLGNKIYKQEKFELESPHPYPNDYDYTWSITKPNASAIRVHFAKIESSDWGDYIIVYDSDGEEIDSWEDLESVNVWSDWASGESISIRLKSDYS